MRGWDLEPRFKCEKEKHDPQLGLERKYDVLGNVTRDLDNTTRTDTKLFVMFIKREIVVNRSKVKWLGYFIGGEGVCVVFGSDVHKRKVSG